MLSEDRSNKKEKQGTNRDPRKVAQLTSGRCKSMYLRTPPLSGARMQAQTTGEKPQSQPLSLTDYRDCYRDDGRAWVHNNKRPRTSPPRPPVEPSFMFLVVSVVNVRRWTRKSC
jgi:hypothetical protein